VAACAPRIVTSGKWQGCACRFVFMSRELRCVARHTEAKKTRKLGKNCLARAIRTCRLLPSGFFERGPMPSDRSQCVALIWFDESKRGP